MNVGNWLQNIQGQLSELASEVMQEATAEVEDPETELQVERKKCAEAERLLVVEKSKNESFEKRITELEEQLYSSNAENDAIRERFEHMIEDRDMQIKQLEIEVENLRDEANARRDLGITLRLELKEKDCEIDKLTAALSETSQQASSLPNIPDVSGRKTSSALPPKSAPPSEAGTESSNNGGWEKMGTEWTAPEAAVGISSTSSESCAGGNESTGGLTITEMERLARGSDPGSVQSSPKEKESESHEDCRGLIESLQNRLHETEHELEESLTKLSSKGAELEEQREEIDQMQQRINRLESELNERSGLLDEMTELLKQKTGDLREKDAEMLRLSDEYGREIGLLRSEMSTAISSMNGDDDSARQIELLKEEVDRMRLRLIQLEEERTRLDSKMETMNEEREIHLSQISQLTEELCSREATLEESRERASHLERELIERGSAEETIIKTNEEDEALISKLREENSELTKLLEGCVAERRSLGEELKVLEREIAERDAQFRNHREQLSSAKDEVDRKDKELMRLREHLVQIEDLSTKEAILAEERETELRKEIRFLQDSSSTYSSSAAESESNYKREMASIKLQLVSSEESVAQLKAALGDREKSLNDVTKSLTSLQSILQELGDDHVKEIAQYEEELKALRAECAGRHEMGVKVTEKENELNENRRFYESQLEVLNAELGRRNRLLEDLENQLEEARLRPKHGRAQTSQVTKEKSPSTYQIDDATLRQLFMSYLLAEKDKQSEIAMVMASILGYSEEEQSLIQEAFSSEGIGSWFGFGGRRSGGGTRRRELSLTEQFVRFLENESRRIEEQPTFPIPQSNQPSTITGVVSISDDRAGTPSTERETADPSSELKSILQT